MSLDIGILIERKKGKIYLFEVNLSTGKKNLVKIFNNSDEVLSYLEKNNIGYESFIIKGFNKKINPKILLPLLSPILSLLQS